MKKKKNKTRPEYATSLNKKYILCILTASHPKKSKEVAVPSRGLHGPRQLKFSVQKKYQEKFLPKCYKFSSTNFSSVSHVMVVLVRLEVSVPSPKSPVALCIALMLGLVSCGSIALCSGVLKCP